MNQPSARAAALSLLQHVLDQRLTLDEARARIPLPKSAPDQRFAELLALTVLRHRGQIDAILAPMLAKPLPPKRAAVSHALRLGVAQLLLLETPAHAAIHETVGLLKSGKDRGLTGLVNAVLQRVGRERPALPHPIANVPDWLATRWYEAYGEDAVRRIAEVAATRPPLDLNGSTACEGAITLDASITRLPADHPPVEHLPGFAEGAFFVQDWAASFPVRMLGDVQGLHVLDACAAPGGKTLQLARAGASVTALDRSAPRLARLRENLARMQLTAEIVTADALTWQPDAPFDAVLLDAPCTATGTWRRHPEVLATLTPADITELASLQRALLARAWSWLKPGGRLVYCTCSLEPEEGEDQAHWFAGTHADATPLTPTSAIPADYFIAPHVLRTRPDYAAAHHGMDGFFAMGWQKRSR